MANCEQKKLQSLLKEAITLLCKSSLTYAKDVVVEGLLGITVDSEDVFLVNLNEIVSTHVTECSRSSHDSESGEKVSRTNNTCGGCHSKQSSTGSESSRKRSLEVSDNSSQYSEASKTDNGPPPLPARRRPKPIEPPNKRRHEIDDSSTSNTSVTTVIVKSQSFIEHDPTYQTLEPETTDPTNNQTVDIFDAPAASLLGTPLASSTVTWGNATTSTQISGSVPRFRPDLDLSNFSSPMFPQNNRADLPDSPPGMIGNSSVHRKQAGRQAVARKRKPVKGRKCLSMDGVLDTPKPSHAPKSFSMDTEDRMKNRYFKRSILLRRHSSRSNGSVSSKSSTLESTKGSSKNGTSDSDNHSCQYCGKTFASNAGLYYHLPIHTGRYKINCKTCGMGFMDTIKYRTHMQKECQQMIPDTSNEKNCESVKDNMI